MKDEILKLLKEKVNFEDVDYCNDKLYDNNEYDMIFEAKMECEKIEIKLKICIPKYWNLYLIDIYITNYMDLPYIPHIGSGGKICFFQLEGNLIEKDLKGIIYNSLSRSEKIIENGINRKNFEDFISEFNSYYSLLPNVKNVKLLIDKNINTSFVDCAILYKKISNQKKDKNIEADTILVSNQISDFNIYKKKYTNVKGILIRIDSDEYIYPPDWREELNSDFINYILNKLDKNVDIVRKYLSSSIRKKFLIFQVKEPNDKVIYFGIQLNNFFLKKESKIEIISSNNKIPLSINVINSREMCLRGGGNIEFNSKKVLVIGCGSIGGYLIEQLAKSGVGNIELIDNDILSEENIYRHVLGMEYVGRYKTEAICQYIKSNIPRIKITSIESKIEEVLEDGTIDLKCYDLIISAVGNHNVNRYINEYIYKKKIDKTVMYVWNEVLDIGNHILIVNRLYEGCYECLFKKDITEEMYDKSSYCKKGQNFTRKMLGCGTEYMPYSSVHSLRIVTYAIEYVKQIMSGRINYNMLFSLKGNDYFLKRLGYETSNRYIKQKELIKILNGEEFKQDECEICKSK